MSFELIETCVTPHLHIPINKCLSYTTGASGGTGAAFLLLYWSLSRFWWGSCCSNFSLLCSI